MICSTTIPWWTYHQSEKSVEAQYLIDLTRSVIPKPEDFKNHYPSSCWDAFYDIKPLSSFASTGIKSAAANLRQVEKATSKHEICVPTVYLASFDDTFSLDYILGFLEHPNISLPLNKNSNWYNGDALKDPIDMPTFKLDLLTYLASFNNEASNLVTMDSSSSLIWRNNRAMDLCTIPTFVHEITPFAKFIVIMKAPWTNTFHSFLRHPAVKFLNDTVPSDAEWFHRCVTSQIMWFTHCLSTGASLATCTYDMELVNWDRLFGFCHFNIGANFYHIHLRRWLTLFSKNQFMFLKMEDFTKNPYEELQRIWKFLGLKSLPNHVVKDVFTVDDTVTKRHFPMLDETALLLKTFFEPFNKELSNLIDDSYLCNDC